MNTSLWSYIISVLRCVDKASTRWRIDRLHCFVEPVLSGSTNTTNSTLRVCFSVADYNALARTHLLVERIGATWNVACTMTSRRQQRVSLSQTAPCYTEQDTAIVWLVFRAECLTQMHRINRNYSALLDVSSPSSSAFNTHTPPSECFSKLTQILT